MPKATLILRSTVLRLWLSVSCPAEGAVWHTNLPCAVPLCGLTCPRHCGCAIDTLSLPLLLLLLLEAVSLLLLLLLLEAGCRSGRAWPLQLQHSIPPPRDDIGLQALMAQISGSGQKHGPGSCTTKHFTEGFKSQVSLASRHPLWEGEGLLSTLVIRKQSSFNHRPLLNQYTQLRA